jgi:hypothetical protein
MAYCGIPRCLPGEAPLRLDLKGSRELAEQAVKDVYQFCSSYDRRTAGRYRRFLLRTRDAIAAKFRAEHGCSTVGNGVEQANVFPYFIGAFDTVAALGNKWLAPIIILAVAAFPVGLHYLGAFLEPAYPWAGRLTRDLGYLSVLVALLVYLRNYLKIAPLLPGYGFLKRLATVHLAERKHRFYDTTLSINVGYAKHAISIDENRADFARVSWSPTAQKAGQRDPENNLYFEQVWFPGVHADVGGGYLENEARLSDSAVGWMVAAASLIPDGLKHDGDVLKLWPSHAGPQHDEQAGGLLKAGLRILPVDPATGESSSPMHKSVYQRFAAGPVVIFDRIEPYRPVNLRTHVDFKQYFGPAAASATPAPNPRCVADDIEAKWQKAGYIGHV